MNSLKNGKNKANKLKTYVTNGNNTSKILLQKYPRPQLRRDNYLCLNGEWEFDILNNEHISSLSSKIVVPFPVESELSGVGKTHKKGEYLHYRKIFSVDFKENENVILHFGAVDCKCKIYLNGSLLGEFADGYLPIDINCTEHAKNGENELYVVCLDDLSKRYPYGKQAHKSKGMWYSEFSGIWQTVWLEVVPKAYVKNVKIDVGLNSVCFFVDGGENLKNIFIDGKNYQFNGSSIKIDIENPKLWSPESPYLYMYTLTSGEDTVNGYFGLRTVEIKEYEGFNRIFLNGKPYFMKGVLDQGYFPDGIVTPPHYACYINDIENMKALGFNTLRKHVKIEPDIFYYECDKHGMLVWQDMVNLGKYSFVFDTLLPTLGFKKRDDSVASEVLNGMDIVFENHIKGVINKLYNHPCIVEWTIFNEGWGQHNSDIYEAFIKELDGSRIVDNASGWFYSGDGDFQSEHCYFKPFKIKKTKNAVCLTEYGGYAYSQENHIYKDSGKYGYKFFKDKNKLTDGIVELINRDVVENIKNGLSASIYTQLSDVECELNGLYTYDRAVLKVDKERIKGINDKCKI